MASDPPPSSLGWSPPRRNATPRVAYSYITSLVPLLATLLRKWSLAARGRDRHRELASALQHCPAACLDRLPGSGPGGVRASARRMAGCATPPSSAGHASAGAKTRPKLTFKPDHQSGADQLGQILRLKFSA